MAAAVLSRPKTQRLWTFDEMLAELPESNLPTELWDGELIRSPAPTPSHQQLIVRLLCEMDGFVSERKLGTVFVSPIDVVLTQRRVVQPDLLFISNKRGGIVQDRIRGVPDLAVEVLSPGTRRRDRVDKKNLYEQFGLPEYWIVDPESRTIEVFVLVKGAYQLKTRASDHEKAASKLLAGFAVSFNQLVV